MCPYGPVQFGLEDGGDLSPRVLAALVEGDNVGKDLAAVFRSFFVGVGEWEDCHVGFCGSTLEL